MKNKLLITAALGSLFALQSCKPEEISPNEVNASGTAIIRGTIFANADESNDFVNRYSSLFEVSSGSPSVKVRINKISNLQYAYDYLDFSIQNPLEVCDANDLGYFPRPSVVGKFSLSNQNFNYGPNSTVIGSPCNLGFIGNEDLYVVNPSIRPGGFSFDTVGFSGEFIEQNFDIFTFMRRYGAPVSGITLTAQYSTQDLASSVDNTFDYPYNVVSATTDANGNYTLAIPANAKDVNVKISLTNKTLDFTPYQSFPAGNNGSINVQPIVFSANEYMDAANVPGFNAISGNIERTLKSGDVITQNFILTPQ